MELKTVEKLISLVKMRPLIYGIRPKRGKKKHQMLLDQLWNEVAIEMNLTERECRLKWTTLRNCYARLLREERLHKVKKRHWHLRNDMNFLRDHIQPYNEHRGCLPKRSMPLKSDSHNTTRSRRNCSLEEESYNTSLSPAQGQDVSNDIPIISSTQIHVIEEKQPEHVEPEAESEIANYCSMTNPSLFSFPERSNEFIEEVPQTKNKKAQAESNSLFLRSLLPDVNKLSDRKQRVFKRKSLELLEFLFDEDESDAAIARDENIARQNQMIRTDQNMSMSIVHDKFIQKLEPRSP